tara:strand:+ start:56 stop:1897 length:1842 start_codon:yes stop_codon:yes gene_type:complete
MSEISTDVSMLEESVNQTNELALELYSKHGSQAKEILTNMQSGAVAAVEKRQTELESQGLNQDAISELMNDYDTLVGGVTREMMANQQAAVSRIESSNVATQNYLNAIGASLPALEARLQSQIDLAARQSAGRSGGRGSSTGSGNGYPSFTGPNPYETILGLGTDPTTGSTTVDLETPLGSLIGAGIYGARQAQATEDADKDTTYKMTADGTIDPLEKELLSEIWGVSFSNQGMQTLNTNPSAAQDLRDFTVNNISSDYGIDPTALETLGEQAFFNEGLGVYGRIVTDSYSTLVENGLTPEDAYKVTSNPEFIDSILTQFPNYELLENIKPDEMDRLKEALDLELKMVHYDTSWLNGIEIDVTSIFGPSRTDETMTNWFTDSKTFGNVYVPATVRAKEEWDNLGEDEKAAYENEEDFYYAWMAENITGYTEQDRLADTQAPKGNLSVGNLDKVVRTEGAQGAGGYTENVLQSLAAQEAGSKGTAEALAERGVVTAPAQLQGLRNLEQKITPLLPQYEGWSRDIDTVRDPLMRLVETSKPQTSNVNPGGGYQSPLKTFKDRFGFLNPFQSSGPRNTEPIDLMANQNRLMELAEDPMKRYSELFLNYNNQSQRPR